MTRRSSLRMRCIEQHKQCTTTAAVCSHCLCVCVFAPAQEEDFGPDEEEVEESKKRGLKSALMVARAGMALQMGVSKIQQMKTKKKEAKKKQVRRTRHYTLYISSPPSTLLLHHSIPLYPSCTQMAALEVQTVQRAKQAKKETKKRQKAIAVIQTNIDKKIENRRPGSRERRQSMGFTPPRTPRGWRQARGILAVTVSLSSL